jgi:hypothetical protein
LHFQFTIDVGWLFKNKNLQNIIKSNVVKFSHSLGLCKLTAPTHPLFAWSLINVTKGKWQIQIKYVTLMQCRTIKELTPSKDSNLQPSDALML